MGVQAKTGLQSDLLPGLKLNLIWSTCLCCKWRKGKLRKGSGLEPSGALCWGSCSNIMKLKILENNLCHHFISVCLSFPVSTLFIILPSWNSNDESMLLVFTVKQILNAATWFTKLPQDQWLINNCVVTHFQNLLFWSIVHRGFFLKCRYFFKILKNYICYWSNF